MSAARTAAIALLAAGGLLAPPGGSAHQPGTSYLEVRPDGHRVHLRVDVALRDLHYLIGLDGDRDGDITWRELRARHAQIAARVQAGVRIESAGGPCVPGPAAHQVATRGDGGYAVVRFVSDCGAHQPDALSYRLLASLDPSHRALVRVDHRNRVSSAMLGPDRHRLDVRPTARPWHRVAADYLIEGADHVLIGIDHLAFLVSLLLPAVLVSGASGWQPRPGWRAVAGDAVAVVTAFTVAHSITLVAAVLGVIRLPAAAVEIAIAATVTIAALNNLVPLSPLRRWRLAFVLGLVHGFGFAGALGGLGLPDEARVLALAAFNLGVEAGQLAVVAVLLPVLYALRRQPLYRPLVVGLGSAAIALLGGVWLLERALELRHAAA